MDETPVQEALHELLDAIDRGEVYEEAKKRLAKRFKITESALQDEYDDLG